MLQHMDQADVRVQRSGKGCGMAHPAGGGEVGVFMHGHAADGIPSHGYWSSHVRSYSRKPRRCDGVFTPSVETQASDYKTHRSFIWEAC